MPVTELPCPVHRRADTGLTGAASVAAVWTALVVSLLATNANALFIVNQPWVYPARQGQTTSAYMNLTSTDGATVLSARSEHAQSVSLRSARAALAAIALPAKSEVALAPGTDHLVLAKLKRTLRAGDRVAITLLIRDASGAISAVDVDAEVRIRSPIDDELRAHHHH
jgi:periplasmic copper chaperone A